jgi:PKD repeat protein
VTFHTDPAFVPQVNIGDGSVVEGNPGGGTPSINFAVTLSAPTTVPVSVAYATADGTATAGSDYDAASGTVTFAPGETSKTITVSVRPDTMYEPDETFNVNLSSPNGVTIADGQGVGTILNDDSPPTITAASSSVTEGNSGTTTMTFTVTLSSASYQPVSVQYATQDDTAVAGSDYSAATGTVTVAPGQTQATFTVNVLGDTTYEPDEQFLVNLSSPTNGSLGTTQVAGTILNDDGIPAISVDSPSVLEGDSGTTSLVFTVSLSNASTDTITVAYATADGTATAGSDYTATSGTLTFAPGETSKAVTVAVSGDTDLEPDETLTLTLSNPVNATLGTGTGTGTGTILNDDYAPVADAGPDQTVSEGATVFFDGSHSSDADNDPLTFTWNFGDGGMGSGPTPTHVYQDNGAYAVTLTVNDGHGGTGTDTMTVTVNNVAPIATGVSGPTLLNEGSTGTYSLTGVTDPSPVDAGSLRYSFAMAAGGLAGSYSAASTTNSFANLFTDNGSYTVYARVYDKDGGISPTYPLAVTVNNVAPAVSATGDSVINEGSAFSGSGSFTDPGADTWTATVDYGDGSGSHPLTLNPDKTYSLGHVYADNGSYNIVVRVTDDDGGVGTKTLGLVVNNVPPTAAVAGATHGVRGQSLGFTFSATDPSSADTNAGFAYAVTWGDGSSETFSGPAAGVTRSHTYVTAGQFQVHITATDKDGGTSPQATAAVNVVAAEVQGDTLFVGGTNAAERISLQPVDTAGGVSVTIAGTSLGTFRPSSRIVVYGLDGNDTIEEVTTRIGNRTYSIGLRAVLDGGAGNDLVDARGSTGANVVLGGAGNDTLYGGSGRDILVGGLGADVLHGGDDDDVLIGGMTDFDADQAAWGAIVNEWSRTDANYSTRVDHLSGAAAGGLNQVGGVYKYLTASTMHTDGSVDDLYGENGSDWFISWSGDVIHDRKNGERVTNL